MRSRRLIAAHPFSEINVTPLIDVVMCLIIFYLIVGKLASDQRSEVPLPPSSVGTHEDESEVFIVNVMPPPAPGQPARFIVDALDAGSAANLESMLAQRKKLKPKVSVQVRASRDLPFGAVEPIYRAARNAGITTVYLAAEPTG
ncbi:MAG: biopolymer transporter ExbD [Phycisphaerae bacterium]|nr:biopolymer transporter ExbD [Phycisphaerae bacterium]